MSLFKSKSKSPKGLDDPPSPVSPKNHKSKGGMPRSPQPQQKQQQQQQQQQQQPERPQLTFHCQQAHGSPTGIISGFSNVKELYEKIAQCYDMSPKEVIYLSECIFPTIFHHFSFPSRSYFAR